MALNNICIVLFTAFRIAEQLCKLYGAGGLENASCDYVCAQIGYPGSTTCAMECSQ